MNKIEMLKKNSAIQSTPEKVKEKQDQEEYFISKKEGLFLVTVFKNKDETKKDKIFEKEIGKRLDIKAKTRESGGENWGVWLEWDDPDGKKHEQIMPISLLSQPGNTWFSLLLAGGYIADPQNSSLIKKYIATQEAQGSARARVVSKTGWTEDSVFVLPDTAIGGGEEKIILNTGAAAGAAYSQGGDFESWKKLAEKVNGNSRLLFSLSAALAGPLLYITGQESGGFNLKGNSSTGKSTALRLAASVWGGEEYVKSWRTTDNAAESTAVFHNDSLLILDELGQATAKTCSEMAYMLSNGAGKSRAGRDGQARAVQNWRVLFLSSGEVGIAQKLAEAGQKPKAGQEVRLVDIDADAGAGAGIFDVCNGIQPGELAIYIKKEASKHYGHAGRMFVEKICENREEAEKSIKKLVEQITKEICPAVADGQVQRVASRFALCGAAGVFAVEKGILPFSMEDIKQAISACFKAWVGDRGGVGNGEERAMLNVFHEFFELHGQSRFQNLSPRKDNNDEDIEQNVTNRAGFRDKNVFYVLEKAWETQIFVGFNPKKAAKLIKNSGYLVEAERENSLKSRKTFPGLGRASCYAIKFEDKPQPTKKTQREGQGAGSFWESSLFTEI